MKPTVPPEPRSPTLDPAADILAIPCPLPSCGAKAGDWCSYDRNRGYMGTHRVEQPYMHAARIRALTGTPTPAAAPLTVAPARLKTARKVAHEIQDELLNTSSGHAATLEIIERAIERDRASRSPGAAAAAVRAVDCPACGAAAGDACDSWNDGQVQVAYCGRRINSALRGEGPSPAREVGKVQKSESPALSGLDAATIEAWRETLRAIAGTTCAYEGSYDSCFEATDDADFDSFCPSCLSRRALAGGPVPAEDADARRYREALERIVSRWHCSADGCRSGVNCEHNEARRALATPPGQATKGEPAK